MRTLAFFAPVACAAGDFAAVLAASEQVGSDVVITVDPSNSITLSNVTLANLSADDFRFF